MASYGKAVTGTAVMARSANEEKKKKQWGRVQERGKAGLPYLYGGGSAGPEWTGGGFVGERERIFGRAGNANL